MRDKIIDNLLNSGTSTLLACVFCYFTFSFFNDELARVHKENKANNFALVQVINRVEAERKKINQDFIDCLKAD
tara:strand:+ start:981 stop:1202 length:222 start_codon:yes stop_codon:yes gene_type:complete